MVGRVGSEERKERGRRGTGRGRWRWRERGEWVVNEVVTKMDEKEREERWTYVFQIK